jgi:hypothetical protein
VGYGFLVDPVELALELQWVDKITGKPADESAVRRDFAKVKAAQHMRYRPASEIAPLTSVRLSDAEMNRGARVKLEQFWSEIKSIKGLEDAEKWPADAQLAVVSMAWAVGTGDRPESLRRGWPQFRSLMAAGRFAEAAEESWIRTTGNPGVRPRNKAVACLLKSAAETSEPDRVNWFALLKERL